MMRRLWLILIGGQVLGFGQSVKNLDPNTTGTDDFLGRLLSGVGQALNAFGLGEETGIRQTLRALADGIYAYLDNLTPETLKAGIDGNKRVYLLLIGGQLKSFGQSLKLLDPDNKGTDDVLGLILENVGLALSSIITGDARNVDLYLRIAADGIYTYLGYEPPPATTRRTV